MIRAVYVNDPDMLRHEMVFQDWKLDETIPPDTFVLSNVADAKHIPFAHPSPESTAASDKPITRKPTTKAQ